MKSIVWMYAFAIFVGCAGTQIQENPLVLTNPQEAPTSAEPAASTDIPPEPDPKKFGSPTLQENIAHAACTIDKLHCGSSCSSSSDCEKKASAESLKRQDVDSFKPSSVLTKDFYPHCTDDNDDTMCEGVDRHLSVGLWKKVCQDWYREAAKNYREQGN